MLINLLIKLISNYSCNIIVKMNNKIQVVYVKALQYQLNTNSTHPRKWQLVRVVKEKD